MYLADASDCTTEQDEQECHIYLQHRLRPGKGGKPWKKKRRFGGGTGNFRRRRYYRPKGA